METTQLEKGDVVWAKVKGYPWWPGTVGGVRCPDDATPEVLVNFIGSNTHAKLSPEYVVPFAVRLSDRVRSKNRKLLDSIKEAKRQFDQKTRVKVLPAKKERAKKPTATDEPAPRKLTKLEATIDVRRVEDDLMRSLATLRTRLVEMKEPSECSELLRTLQGQVREFEDEFLPQMTPAEVLGSRVGKILSFTIALFHANPILVQIDADRSLQGQLERVITRVRTFVTEAIFDTRELTKILEASDIKIKNILLPLPEHEPRKMRGERSTSLEDERGLTHGSDEKPSTPSSSKFVQQPESHMSSLAKRPPVNTKLRRKVCQKLARESKEKFALASEESQTLALAWEEKLRIAYPDMNAEYKTAVCNLMRLIKRTELLRRDDIWPPECLDLVGFLTAPNTIGVLASLEECPPSPSPENSS